jgi:aminopeptidase
VTYTPPQQILERYAAVLIDFGLGNGRGIKSGDVVRVLAPEDAKPLFVEVCKAVWRRGAHVIPEFQPANDAHSSVTAAFYELASDAQLDWAPLRSGMALFEQLDHSVHIVYERDPHALARVDPEKLMRARRARRQISDVRIAKELIGNYSWVIGLYGGPGMAAEAGMTTEEYWQQIIAGCHLEDPDPVARWQEINADIARYSEWLNSLQIRQVHIEGADADLRITIGTGRRFIGGGGANIPTYEIYTSPDWRGTEGWIRFNQPAYHYGSLIEGVELRFAGGRVIEASATRNQALLEAMIDSDAGSDKLGEFSLTDNRLSPIERFMAETLYDENIGGPFGNTHVALGESYRDTYDGDAATVPEEQWAELGFNSSSIHNDIISTTDRTVTATLADATTMVIYEGGRFTLS